MFISGSYKVFMAGKDITSKLSPHVISLSIQRSAGESADTLNLKLSDPGGSLLLPPTRAEVSVELNGIWAFDGFVSEVTCDIDKAGGRQVSVACSSVDDGGRAKEPSLQHKDKAAFKDVAAEWGNKVGMQVEALGSIASVERDYWLQQNESFISWGQRMGREIGATFKVIGKRAFFAARNEGLSASGRPLTAISAAVGVNLLQASITPVIARPKYKNVKLAYFDIAKGEKVEVDADTGIMDAEAVLRSPIAVVNEAQAKQKAAALGRESDRDQGQGSVTILGDPRAEPEAICTVRGVRSGVDGTYRLHSVTHNITKGEGFTTKLELRQPKDGAGKDPRDKVGTNTGG